jgi:hypothetical protein
MAKFVENNYEKVDKLLEIRDGASARLKLTDQEIEAEKKVEYLLVSLQLSAFVNMIHCRSFNLMVKRLVAMKKTHGICDGLIMAYSRCKRLITV